jgi:molybdopterin converting factor small subunit
VPVVRLPSLLRPLAGGASQVRATGATLREVIDDIDRQHPGLKERILDGDHIRGDTMLAVNADEAQDLNTPVAPDAEVHILPSIAGG